MGARCGMKIEGAASSFVSSPDWLFDSFVSNSLAMAGEKCFAEYSARYDSSFGKRVFIFFISLRLGWHHPTAYSFFKFTKSVKALIPSFVIDV